MTTPPLHCPDCGKPMLTDDQGRVLCECAPWQETPALPELDWVRITGIKT
jgi:hypothetical protein